MAANLLGDFDLFELSQKEIELLLEPFEIPEQKNVKARDAQCVNVDEFINEQKKPNTVSRTASDVKNVQRWLFDNKRETRSIENIIPSHLNEYLAELFVSIRRADGEDYEPVSLECIKNSIERHLKDMGYPVSLKDRVFHKATQALQAKKRELAKRGKGKAPNKSEDLTADEEDKLYECRSFGDSNPVNLQRTIFYHFGTQFGLRARDEARQLKFGDIELKSTVKGEKYLEFSERTSKTRDGTNLKLNRTTIPRIYSAGNLPSNRDPIKLYEMFVKRRPAEMLDPESPFYLTPVPEKKLQHNETEAWYYPRPMGRNSLGEHLKSAAAEANLQKKVTNHSVRKTTVTKLSRAGVAPQKIMKITGHRGMQSITHYDALLTETEQKDMCSILQGQIQKVPSMIRSSGIAAPTTLPSQVDESDKTGRLQLLDGCTFHNCTFNF